ncbi:MAG TPA: PDZ domain-containing protein, partial [Lysobacter sp.]
MLGVLLDADATRGVRVSGVTPESGAAKAGLRTGDRILSIDGKPVEGADGHARLERLRAMLADIKEDKALRVGYERDGKPAAASVTPQRSAPVTLFNGDGSEMRPHGNVRFIGSEDGGLTFEAKSVEVVPAPGQPLRLIQHTSADGKTVTRRIVRTDASGATRDALAELPGVSPRVHSEILRLARDGSCKDGENCRSFALAEAFRWNGLNLASLDANLGRYFGTTDGVLVVSASPELAGLQSGDVIRKVDGHGVSSPREVMDALRGKPEGATVGVEYLRDRKAATAQLKVPKAMRIPLPP